MKCIIHLLIGLCLGLTGFKLRADGGSQTVKKPLCESAFLSAWKNESPVAAPLDNCIKHPWVRQLNGWLDSQISQEEAELLLISPVREFETPPALHQAEKMVAAAVLARSGKIIEARQLWKTLTIEKPKWAEPWFNLGLLNAREGSWEEAKFCFQQGKALCSQHGCRVQENVWNTLLKPLENSP